MDKSLLNGVGIFIPVSDLERSTQWYNQMLGFEILHNDEPLANVLKMGDGVVVFCLVKSYNIEQPMFPKNEYNVDHYFNFHTGNIDKAYQLLLEKGANVGELHEFDGMRGFDIYDPDGNRFSVIK
jgi:lactoylglutathione lyase